ncbi:MAG: hypothetical protein JWO06_2965 [Bacteroidota bacterium]|nr:hypothetical protein [Bacteroidota bacterium]
MQKLILFLALVIFSFQLKAQDPADLEAFEKAIKPGAQLSYDVTTKETQYKLTIILKKLGPEMAFDWKTTGGQTKSGSVTMSANALTNATALFSNFMGGGDSKLDRETSLWLSKKVVTDVTSTTQASIKLRGSTDSVTVLSNATTSLGFNVDGNFVTLPIWELQGGDPKCTVDVLESKFPLIYKMDIGWSMVLTEVKSQ